MSGLMLTGDGRKHEKMAAEVAGGLVMDIALAIEEDQEGATPSLWYRARSMSRKVFPSVGGSSGLPSTL